MFPWGDAQTTFGHAVGDTVYSDGSPEPGRVVSVDAETATMGIVWSGSDGGTITYPLDATYIRKKMPWE